MARAIAARWGGRITLDSAPGTGSTVTVLFPAAQDQASPGDHGGTRDNDWSRDQAGTGDTDAR